MKRRNFLSNLSFSFPLLGLGISPLQASSNQKESLKISTRQNSDGLIDKVTLAMLSLQRAAWEQGTAMHGLIEIGKKDLVVLMAKEAVLRQHVDGRLGMLYSDSQVTDPGSNGAGVLFAYKETGDEKFKKAAEAQLNYFKTTISKTKDGILHHITNAKQIWSDAMFMAPPFIALMGDFDEAIKQVEGIRKYLWDNEKKLFSHMYDETKNELVRKAFWGGGNGWCTAGMSQIINMLPKDRESDRRKLITYAKDVIDGCLLHQREDGLFHDIVDDPKSFVETNLAQMIAYAIYTGIKAGWLDNTYLSKADKMRQAAHSKLDKFGLIQGACSSPNFDRPGTSTEAQAFFLMMEGAYKRLP